MTAIERPNTCALIYFTGTYILSRGPCREMKGIFINIVFQISILFCPFHVKSQRYVAYPREYLLAARVSPLYHVFADR